MSVRVKMPSCFGSSKRPRRELIWEPALQRGALWKNVQYLEHKPNGELVKGVMEKPLCQELLIHITGPSGKLEYMPTDRGHPMPLTLAACHAEWDDYLDLTETVTEMAHRLIKEDGQEVATPPKTQGGHHSQEEGGCERPRAAGEHRYQLGCVQPIPG